MLRDAVRSPAFRLKFGQYVVTGDPVLRAGVASALPNQAAILLVAAALLIAVALALAFRGRFPLLPLGLALAAVAVAFGVARLAGASLTPAAVALLPALVGLSAAFTALLQDRLTGRDGARIALAGAVVAAGLLALLFSPVPMTRTFGAVAIGGLVLAFAAALTLGIAIPTVLGRLPAGHISLGRSARLDRWAGAAFGAAVRRPRRTLWVALGVAVVGWALGTQAPAVSDLRSLAPSDRQEVKDANLLRDQSRSEGQVSVLVHGKDLADPRAVAWMSDYQGRILVRHGYTDRKPCRAADLCPGLSLTNIFPTPPRTERQVLTGLRSLPEYFSHSVITPDRHTANMSFVLTRMSAERRQKVIDDMRAQLHPPAGGSLGLTAEVAGQPAVDAATRSDLVTGRWWLGILALVLVFGVLLAVHRRAVRAILPLVPAVLATGWTALVVWIFQLPVTPVSIVLGALLIAVGSALGALLYEHYAAARAAGRSPGEALDAAWRTGRPDVTVPALVLGAGLLALTVSDFSMFRDFGEMAVAGLVLEVAALMLVLPAALLVAEEGVSVRGAARQARVRAAGAMRAAAAGVRRVSPSRK
jgi:predicted RND superfamily exporter protein